VSGRNVDTDGTPVRACVGARPPAGGSDRYDSAPAAGDGRYRLGGLRTQRLVITISDCSYPSTHVRDEFQIDAVQGRELDAGTRVLARSATITGTVRDAAGAPASGICVAARGDADASFFYGGNTDAAGRYSVPGLPAGSYRVKFQPCGGSSSSATAYEWFEDAIDESTATAVGGTAGATSVADVTLESGTGITGRVVGPDGAPVSSQCVAVTPDGATDVVAYATTSVTGSYRIGTLR
jgi:hypothetical protein